MDLPQFEYTINQGIAPTLIFPVPSSAEHPIMSIIIHSIKDYYPLWQASMRRARIHALLTALSPAARLSNDRVLVALVHLAGTASAPRATAQSPRYRPGSDTHDPRGGVGGRYLCRRV